jgi:hypothetical protein
MDYLTWCSDVWIPAHTKLVQKAIELFRRAQKPFPNESNEKFEARCQRAGRNFQTKRGWCEDPTSETCLSDHEDCEALRKLGFKEYEEKQSLAHEFSTKLNLQQKG